MRAIVTAGQLRQLADKLQELFQHAKTGRYGSLEGILNAVSVILEDGKTNALELSEFESPLFSVDYRKPIETMIVEGNYDLPVDLITSERFPISGSGVVRFERRYGYSKNGGIESDEIERLIGKASMVNPWMPAKIEHLLAIGIQFPEDQRNFKIVALGSVANINGSLYVPSLGMFASSRLIALCRRDSKWSSECRILMVREVPAF